MNKVNVETARRCMQEYAKREGYDNLEYCSKLINCFLKEWDNHPLNKNNLKIEDLINMETERSLFLKASIFVLKREIYKRTQDKYKRKNITMQEFEKTYRKYISKGKRIKCYV